MASKMIAVAHGNTALSLALTGITVEELHDVKDAEKRLVELLDSQHEVVIADERYRDELSEWFQLRMQRHSGLPILIFCPTFDEEDAGTDAYINAIVKPAVGFEIRLD